MAAPAGRIRTSFVRDFTMEIGVSDPIGLHSSEATQIIMRDLVRIFAGRCCDDCLILDILEVVDMSAAEIGYGPNIGAGQVRVCFNARVMQYVPGDTQAGLKITEKDDKTMSAELHIGGIRRIFAKIPVTETNASIRVGQFVIVRFERLAYARGSQCITAIAALLEPPMTNRVYQCDGEYVVTMQAEELVKKLAKLQKDLAAATGWERCRDAIAGIGGAYPPAPSGATVANLATLALREGRLPAYIARDFRLPTLANVANVYTYNDPIFPGDYDLVQGVSTDTVILELLRAEIDAITLLLDMAEVYAGALFDEHKNIWMVIRSMRGDN